MKLTEKGQITVPKWMRERYGMQHGTEVEFEATDAGVVIRPVGNSRADRIKEAIKAVRGTADVNMRTDAIMKLTRE